jgi:superfamily II DNA/RNA helicase
MSLRMDRLHSKSFFSLPRFSADYLVLDSSPHHRSSCTQFQKRELDEARFHAVLFSSHFLDLMCLCSVDLIAQAKSGTGKTCVFAVTALESVKAEMNWPQCLIVSPTREIAVQIRDVVRLIGKYVQGMCVRVCVFGVLVVSWTL